MTPWIHGGTFYICIQMNEVTTKERYTDKTGRKRWRKTKTVSECHRRLRTEARMRRHLRRCHFHA